MSALVLGATGLCGNFFLNFVNSSAKLNKVYTITRSKPDVQGDTSKVESLMDKDNANWINIVSELDGPIDYIFSALATTRTDTGSTEAQYKIDHDLNIELAKAAKAKGCKTVVVVSSFGANVDSRFFYARMKGEIERDLADIGFERTIILRPGVILGDRGEKTHSGTGNGFATKLGNMLYRSKLQRLFFYPVQAEEIGKVGVYLALKDTGEKVQIVESKEILDIAAKIKDLAL